MAIILYKDGAYQLYSTIHDTAMFESALTLDQVTQEIRRSSGQAGINSLPDRLARAHAKGCSSGLHDSLKSLLLTNHAGVRGTVMPYEEFLAKFLTFAATPTMPEPLTNLTVADLHAKLGELIEQGMGTCELIGVGIRGKDRFFNKHALEVFPGLQKVRVEALGSYYDRLL